MTTQYGTKLFVGATSVATLTLPNAGTYIKQSITENEADVRQSMVFDADGAPLTRLVNQIIKTYTLTLICYAAADPVADFPKGTVITMDGTAYRIESAPVEQSKDPWTVTLQLKAYNLAAV